MCCHTSCQKRELDKCSVQVASTTRTNEPSAMAATPLGHSPWAYVAFSLHTKNQIFPATSSNRAACSGPSSQVWLRVPQVSMRPTLVLEERGERGEAANGERGAAVCETSCSGFTRLPPPSLAPRQRRRRRSGRRRRGGAAEEKRRGQPMLIRSRRRSC